MKIFAVTLLLILATTLTCRAQEAPKQLANANNALESQLSTLKVSDELNKQCTNDIAAARNALKLGNPYLSLYTIRTCYIELESLSYAASKADIATKGAEAFEQEWRQLAATLNDKEQKFPRVGLKQLPAVVIGLADASQTQVNSYYQSGRLIALKSNIAEGLLQLGRATANLDFALFCRGLRFPAPKSTMEFRSVAPELRKLETAALRTYKSVDAGTQQAEFTGLKSNLELAEKLNAESKFEGALFKYLESHLYFGLIITSAEKEDLQHLRERSGQLRKLLTARKNDNSIALLFWQMAEEALDSATSEQPTQSQIKRAVVILNIVVPDYLDYLKTTQVGKQP
ncbi:MAG TPA: hypothetical protein VJ372_09120 [Pyrinomonadaceae bacterium]|jgi:hypothetical protein|nr:hypothetical protein [Pyrinomonadaceae bacterium]